jgi:hypothetical protein
VYHSLLQNLDFSAACDEEFAAETRDAGCTAPVASARLAQNLL